MSMQNPVAGITELASMAMVLKNFPELVPDILLSVALPAEEKYLRKHQMVLALSKLLGLDIKTPDVKIREKGLDWGYSFATDFSTLFVLKQLGSDVVEPTYPNGLPEKLKASLSDLDLDFMMKVNPHAYNSVPDALLGSWYQIFLDNGLRPYESKDWSALKRAISLVEEPVVTEEPATNKEPVVTKEAVDNKDVVTGEASEAKKAPKETSKQNVFRDISSRITRIFR